MSKYIKFYGMKYRWLWVGCVVLLVGVALFNWVGSFQQRYEFEPQDVSGSQSLSRPTAPASGDSSQLISRGNEPEASSPDPVT
jgi:nitric oxide reductase large subunit